MFILIGGLSTLTPTSPEGGCWDELFSSLNAEGKFWAGLSLHNNPDRVREPTTNSRI